MPRSTAQPQPLTINSYEYGAQQLANEFVLPGEKLWVPVSRRVFVGFCVVSAEYVFRLDNRLRPSNGDGLNSVRVVCESANVRLSSGIALFSCLSLSRGVFVLLTAAKRQSVMGCNSLLLLIDIKENERLNGPFRSPTPIMRFFGILLALLLARVATFTFVMAQTAPSIISNADPGLNFYPQYCPGLLLDNCTGGWSNTVLGNGATVKASNGPASPNDPLPSVNFTFLGSAMELHTLQDPHGAVMLIQLDGHAWQFNSSLDSITQQPVAILNVTGLGPNVTHTLTVSWSNSSSSTGGRILYFDSLVIAGYGIPPNTSESNTTPPTSFSPSLPMSTLPAPADTASGLPLTQSNDQSPTVKRSWPPAYIATVVLIAALFAIFVAISIFLFCRNRRLRSQLRVTPWSTGGTETPIPSDQFAPKRRHQIFSDFGLHRATGDNGELRVSPFRVSIYADIRRESRASEDVENDGASQVPSSNRSSFTIPSPPRTHASTSEPFRVLESQWDRTELPSSPTFTSTTDSPRYSSISGSTSTSTTQSGWQSKDLHKWDRGKFTFPAHRTKGSVDCLMLNDALGFEHRKSFQTYGTPPPAYAFRTQ